MGNSYPFRLEKNRSISNVQTIGRPAPPLTRLRDWRSDGHSNAEKIAGYVCMNITIVSATGPLEP
jgi:hypothetical protein